MWETWGGDRLSKGDERWTREGGWLLRDGDALLELSDLGDGRAAVHVYRERIGDEGLPAAVDTGSPLDGWTGDGEPVYVERPGSDSDAWELLHGAAKR